MKKPTRMLTSACTVVLGLCLFNSALAAEVPGAGQVPLKSMTQAEYETYRQQLDQQVKSATAGTSGQNSSTVDKEPAPATESEPDSSDAGSGYGKGYCARIERNSRTGRTGGFRGGSMGHGGGRNR